MNTIDHIASEIVNSAFKVHKELAPIHHAQLTTCLKLSHKTLGLLINFNVPLIKNGIRRIANQFQES